MRFWLFKSEPQKFSWAMLQERGERGQEWDGVRNYGARNNMRLMAVGDRGFFYHSNEGLAVVGVMEVCVLSHPDSTAAGDPRWDCVDVRAYADMPVPVTLSAIRANPALKGMALVVNSRLSVQPVTDEEWREVCRMGGLAV